MALVQAWPLGPGHSNGLRRLPVGLLGRSCPKNGPKGAQALHTKTHDTPDAQVRNFWSVDPVFRMRPPPKGAAR